MTKLKNSAAPFGFADHQGGDLLGFGFSVAGVYTASAIGIPAKLEGYDLQSQR